MKPNWPKKVLRQSTSTASYDFWEEETEDCNLIRAATGPQALAEIFCVCECESMRRRCMWSCLLEL